MRALAGAGPRLRGLAIVAGVVALVVLPPAGAARLAPHAERSDGDAWLFDPLHVNEIDLNASAASLASLRDAPTSYVDAEIILHDGTAAYGPYAVGLKLRGHASFRDLDGKAAFKVKFGYSVPKQEFQGLKSLTLNNMVQDPSMIAEAASSILLRAVGVPAPRVGYAFVRLNGSDYGLYANVETIDKEMAKRWFPSTRHIYDAGYAADVIPGDIRAFDVSAGPSGDTSDLDALIRAASGDAAGWSDRMKPVADLAEMARAFAAEHYIGQWDGYSYGSQQTQPNNYELHSDDTGRFSMIITGTDQTWLDGENFGLTGNGVLLRECLADPGCQPLYMSALREIAGNRDVAALADTARAIDAAIAPWRRRDPRREQSAADGEEQAAAKIAFIAGRRGELSSWLGTGPSSLRNPPPASSARPVFGKPLATPDAPAAGKPFTLSVPVTRSDTGGPVTGAKLVCLPLLGQSAAAHVASLENGRVRLSLRVPAEAGGKLLRIRLEVTALGRTGLAVYTYPVR